MSWDAAESSALEIDESYAGSGANGPWIELASNEMCHYTVVRSDGLSGDRWKIEEIPSLNSSRADNAPARVFVLEDTQTIKSFRVYGWCRFRVRIKNAETSPADQVETDHYWKKNGVNI